jgi:hypothetical protein
MVGPVFESKSLGWPLGYADVSPAEPNEHIALPGSQSNLHAMTEVGRPGCLSYLGRGLSELLGQL